MNRIALKMLFGDKGKYLSLVVGLSFAVLLIAQQGAIFLGLVKRSTGPLQNTAQPDFWVVDPHTEYVGDIRPLAERDLARVRSVAGVAWAEPFFTSRGNVDLPNGSYKTAQIIGISRSTMIGQPPEILEGRLDDLRAPDAIMVEASALKRIGPLKIGDVLRLNDKRARVVGIVRAKLGFDSNAIFYTTIDNAIRFTPVGREAISFFFVKAKEGADRAAVAEGIKARTGLDALTQQQFTARTVRFILTQTGIGINFGITVALGFVVGLAVVGAVFYQFTLENLRHFAVLKAMGTRNRRLVGMVLLQALVVGCIGYGIGVGLAGAFSLTGRRPGAELSVLFPWQLMVVALFSMLACTGLGSLLSIRRVMRLEPAVVFK
ncbi:MAG: ABC transporter permease [Phycisphaerales bacterium]|nr:ABC transporter permease [Phycisphaerales bacterium]